MSTLWQDIKTEFIYTRSVVTRIIFINAVIFLLANLVNEIFILSNSLQDTNFITDYAGISPNIHTVLYRPWTIITYGFLHLNFFHILFNMLMLYWFGNIFVEFLGNKKFLPVFLLGIITGGLFFILLYNIIPVFHDALNGSSMIGASAGVLAVVVATATLLPDYTMFIFLIGPVKLKWIALVLVLIDLISIDPRNNAGGHIAHLGGALLGYVYIKQLRRGNDLGSGLNAFFDWVVTIFTGRKKIKVVSSNLSSVSEKKKSPQVDTKHQEKLDVILDKISRSGYESLSKEEKEFLFNFSKKDH